MSSRVLVADDSKTIQKVINITLANSGYELVEIFSESELIKKIDSDSFDLILLDFSLSETRTGYELAKIVHEKRPEAAIIAMLGTFDPFDDNQAAISGIADKIVKPFESSKFIKKCRDVLELSASSTPFSAPGPQNVSEAKDIKPEDDFDSWKVEAPRIYEKEPETKADLIDVQSLEDSPLDPLSSEMKGWGFTASTPSKMSLEDKYHKVFPPIIEEAPVEKSVIENLFEDHDIALSGVESSGEDQDRTDPSFHVPTELNPNLIDEIEDDISPDDFWKVDNVVAVNAIEAQDIEETKLDEVTADLTEKVQAFREQEKASQAPQPVATPAPAPVSVPVESVNINQDELLAKLKESLRPMIEELVKEYCRQNAEKVAWEVIPDLAENLIRKEIKDITNSL